VVEGREWIEALPAWEDIPWIRERWDGPLVIKGILTVEDASRAVAEGGHHMAYLDDAGSFAPILRRVLSSHRG
jgi:isopentenyl diphosphate isomerase/L-lactate dehydrogenase-like FMN-dependent dehydrogenase